MNKLQPFQSLTQTGALAGNELMKSKLAKIILVFCYMYLASAPACQAQKTGKVLCRASGRLEQTNGRARMLTGATAIPFHSQKARIRFFYNRPDGLDA